MPDHPWVYSHEETGVCRLGYYTAVPDVQTEEHQTSYGYTQYVQGLDFVSYNDDVYGGFGNYTWLTSGSSYEGVCRNYDYQQETSDTKTFINNIHHIEEYHDQCVVNKYNYENDDDGTVDLGRVLCSSTLGWMEHDHPFVNVPVADDFNVGVCGQVKTLYNQGGVCKSVGYGPDRQTMLKIWMKFYHILQKRNVLQQQKM